MSDAEAPCTNGFPKDLRLRKTLEFQKVYNDGEKRISRSFVLFRRPNGLGYSRFGLTTPRKLGKAHDRNRIKRRIREILRTSRPSIPKSFDFVLNPRRAANAGDIEDLRLELIALIGADK